MRVAVDASTIVHARGQECRVLEEHGDDVGQLEGRVGRRASAGARELASHGQAEKPILGLEEGWLGGAARGAERVAAAVRQTAQQRAHRGAERVDVRAVGGARRPRAQLPQLARIEDWLLHQGRVRQRRQQRGQLRRQPVAIFQTSATICGSSRRNLAESIMSKEANE